MFNVNQTICFKNEFERNITIKLGYANAKYINVKMTDVLDQCVTRHMENTRMKLLRHVSIVDCPVWDVLSNNEVVLVTWATTGKTMIKQLPDYNELELPRTICMLAEKL
ncbi:hypothetical protein ACET3Z_024719 [Daucus carota]